MLEWYAWLSQLNAALSEPLTTWSERLNIPVLTALLLGLLGSTAPCQLTTNASAMALVAQRMADVKRAWQTALAYTAGKVVVYTLVGSLILRLGLQLDLATIPLALASQGGWIFPGTFAIGTAFPLLGFTYVLSLGTAVAQRYMARIKGLERYLRRITGAIFLGAGLNDTLTYWAF